MRGGERQIPKHIGYFAKRERWHKWFAWHPVYIETSKTKRVLVWWESIERKGYYYSDPAGSGWYWEYRFLEV